MKLLCDKKASISTAHNPMQHDRTKHVEVDQHFINENFESGMIRILVVPTNQQTTDLFTKGLFHPNFEFLISKLGVIDIYAPT